MIQNKSSEQCAQVYQQVRGKRNTTHASLCRRLQNCQYLFGNRAQRCFFRIVTLACGTLACGRCVALKPTCHELWHKVNQPHPWQLVEHKPNFNHQRVSQATTWSSNIKFRQAKAPSPELIGDTYPRLLSAPLLNVFLTPHLAV